VIALIASAGSGRGVDANDVTRRVRAAGAADVRTFPIQELDSVADTSPERIVVASGDGGVGPAAELAARLEVPLAVIPAGTANNFAAAAEIPTDLGQACRLAVTGERTRTMELGYAGDLPFINLASAGLAPVAGEKAARWKHALGPAAYTVGAAAAALTTPPIECQITADGRHEFAGRTWQVMVAITGAFGSGIRVEGTDTSDGALDLVVFEAGPRTELMRRGWWTRRGRLATQPGAVRARACSFDVDVAPGTRFNVDGEIVELGPTCFTVKAEAFRLVVPA